MRSRDSGLTLIELLVAMSVAALILLLVGSMLASARAAEGGLTTGVEPRAALDLAAELLRKEVTMAGFVPFAGERPEPTDAGSGAPGFALALVRTASGQEELKVTFVDDRLASGPLPREFGFSSAYDSRGEAQLYRRSGDSPRQPLVAGVSSFEVRAYLDDYGFHELAAAPSGELLVESLRGLVLRLGTPSGEHRAVLVDLPSRPGLRFTP